MQFDCTPRSRDEVESALISEAGDADSTGYRPETILATQERWETLPAPVPLSLRVVLAAAAGIQARSLPPPDHTLTLNAKIGAIWTEALDLPLPERLRIADFLVAALERLVAGGVGRGC